MLSPSSDTPEPLGAKKEERISSPVVHNPALLATAAPTSVVQLSINSESKTNAFKAFKAKVAGKTALLNPDLEQPSSKSLAQRLPNTEQNQATITAVENPPSPPLLDMSNLKSVLLDSSDRSSGATIITYERQPATSLEVASAMMVPATKHKSCPPGCIKCSDGVHGANTTEAKTIASPAKRPRRKKKAAIPGKTNVASGAKRKPAVKSKAGIASQPIPRRVDGFGSRVARSTGPFRP